MVRKAEVDVWGFVVRGMGAERSCQRSLWKRETTSPLGGRECQYVQPRVADLLIGVYCECRKNSTILRTEERGQEVP